MSHSESAAADGEQEEDFERWVTSGFAAASFTGLIQLSTLTPPTPWGLQWLAALGFSISLVAALVGLFLALVVKGRLVRAELPAQWLRRVNEALTVCMSGATLGAGAGAACISGSLLDPSGGGLGWPSWIFIGGAVAIGSTITILVWAQKRESRRKRLGS